MYGSADAGFAAALSVLGQQPNYIYISDNWDYQAQVLIALLKHWLSIQHITHV